MDLEKRPIGNTPKDSSGDKPGKGNDMSRTHAHGQRSANPGWANGLRQLYDTVVEEPLPDQFKDLLSKLDNKD
ncbi:NepR family anti-sigma factor [Tsuneonella amylolytica]|uniref:NepR family anti-sigma factor n=1 Tax=Tsuneonella amylolytica TaxID=2338327 RepID=UPI000EA9F150|nr:NepR family anti-sigma factor [Tsuneonella amylolytica]